MHIHTHISMHPENSITLICWYPIYNLLQELAIVLCPDPNIDVLFSYFFLSLPPSLSLTSSLFLMCVYIELWYTVWGGHFYLPMVCNFCFYNSFIIHINILIWFILYIYLFIYFYLLCVAHSIFQWYGQLYKFGK